MVPERQARDTGSVVYTNMIYNTALLFPLGIHKVQLAGCKTEIKTLAFKSGGVVLYTS